MWSSRRSARALTFGTLIAVTSSGVLPLAGCGESEAPIKSTDKKRDDLQKEIENPLGIPEKAAKGKPSRSRR